MDTVRIARELVVLARRMMADANLDKIELAVKNAKSMMDVGSELKKARIKYVFSFSPVPNYLIRMGGSKYMVVNKKYADKPDKVVGEIAIGKM